MRTLRTMFGARPLENVLTPSSRPILIKPSRAFLYPNLLADTFAPSAHIRTRTI